MIPSWGGMRSPASARPWGVFYRTRCASESGKAGPNDTHGCGALTSLLHAGVPALLRHRVSGRLTDGQPSPDTVRRAPPSPPKQTPPRAPPPGRLGTRCTTCSWAGTRTGRRTCLSVPPMHVTGQSCPSTPDGSAGRTAPGGWNCGMLGLEGAARRRGGGGPDPEGAAVTPLGMG